MATIRQSGMLRHLRYLAVSSGQGEMTDGELLRGFLTHQDEAAFEALVRRHGPMVLGVCRRVLAQEADAEDAFQATFLVLVRKASSIHPPDMVGNWLYGVAYRTAMKARSMSSRRNSREQQVDPMPQQQTSSGIETSDWKAVLDEELQRLPDGIRAAIVLSDLEGRSRREVARQLQIPEGTLSSRLARGRVLLAKRLSQRGVVLSGGALAGLLGHTVSATGLPANLVHSTVSSAMQCVAGKAAAEVVSAKVAALSEGVLRTMTIKKVTITSLLIIAASLTGLNAARLVLPAIGNEQAPAINLPAQNTPPKNGAQEKTDLELMQGKWQAVKAMDGGDEIPADSVEKLVVVFSGKTMEIVKKGKATFTLDPTKKPKHIDLIINGKTSDGIYELEGSTLKIVVDEAGNRGRPTAFTSEPASANDMYLILKKVESPKKKPQKLEANKQKPPAAANDLETIQGTWRPVQVLDGERAVEKNELDSTLVVFNGKRMEIKEGEKVRVSADFTLDPTKKPKHIDFTDNGRFIPGIYELENDTLKIVIDEGGERGRPNAFKSEINTSNDLYMILKRVEPLKNNAQPSTKKLQAPARTPDLRLLQGKWRPMKVMDGGRVEEQAKHAKTRIYFNGQNMKIDQGNGKVEKATIQLNPAKTPKHIDFVVKGKTIPGIYKVDGANLHLVLDEGGNRGRPTAFPSESGTANDLYMVLVKVPEGKKQDLPPVPNAVPFSFGKEFQAGAKSNPIQVNGKPFHIIRMGTAKFELSKNFRLTAGVKAGVVQYADVDYWIHAAVFDKSGRLLGTASHLEKVRYISLGVTPMIFREMTFDFGISTAYRNAAFVVFTIGDRDIKKGGAGKE